LIKNLDLTKVELVAVRNNNDDLRKWGAYKERSAKL
jgi:hypothetical protein